MSKRYIRPKQWRREETTRECGKCNTVWRASWLTFNQDNDECPFCGALFELKESAVVTLPKIKKKQMSPKTRSLIKNVLATEARIKVNAIKVDMLEGMTVKEKEENAVERALRQQHLQKNLVKKRNKDLIKLSELTEKLNKNMKQN